MPPPLMMPWPSMQGMFTMDEEHHDMQLEEPVWLVAQLPSRGQLPQPRCDCCSVCTSGDKKQACVSRELLDKTDFCYYSPASDYFLISPATNEIAVLQPLEFPMAGERSSKLLAW